jgi:hypothetical protein
MINGGKRRVNNRPIQLKIFATIGLPEENMKPRKRKNGRFLIGLAIGQSKAAQYRSIKTKPPTMNGWMECFPHI